jgi:hypothetical protein
MPPTSWTWFATISASARRARFPKKATCLAIYSYAVNAQLSVGETLDRAFPWCAEWAEPLKGLFARYVEAKQAQAVLDTASDLGHGIMGGDDKHHGEEEDQAAHRERCDRFGKW